MKKSITDLNQGFEKAIEQIKLEKENKALHETIDKLTQEIDRLRNLSEAPKSNIIKLHILPEEEILDQQIGLLQKVSRTRMLEVNEAKMLDLYIKNKRLIQEKSTMNAEFTSLPVDNMTNEELLKLIEGEKSDKENESTERSGEGPLE
jgi:uncharacterized membrane-anchored protein YjiN (DUF445 family)